MIKGFLVDLDDTLLDFQHTQLVALERVHAGFFAPFVGWERFFDEFRGINHHLWDMQSRGQIGFDELRVQRFQRTIDRVIPAADVSATQIAAAYETAMGEVATLLPGALQFLEAVRQRGHLAIVTNGLAVVQRSRLARCGILSAADALFISEETGYSKPDARAFTEAARLLKCQPAECVVIGDSLTTDGLGAKNAGIEFWWLNLKSVTGDRAATIATREFRGLAAIVDHLQLAHPFGISGSTSIARWMSDSCQPR